MKSKSVLKILREALHLESNKIYKGYSAENSRSYKCSIKNCINLAYAKRLCNAHYLRKRQGRLMDEPIRCRFKDPKRRCSCGDVCGAAAGWYLCQPCYTKRRKDIIKSEVIKILGGRCKRCKKKFPAYVFDFHHVGNKTGAVGEMFHNASLKRIADEIIKCILLCANCHREVTYG
jgi:hypothetical protein